MSLQPSLAQTVRAVQLELARHTLSTQAPKVVWAGLEETPEAFAERCEALRHSWAGRVLAAVPHLFPVPEGIEPVTFAPKLFRLMHPRAPKRYRCASGGRGSAKSHSFATAVLLRMLAGQVRVLAAREVMKSLRESVHHLLAQKIDKFKLSVFFDISDREIACKINGSVVIFAGLMSNVTQLKSLEGVDLAWIEEGESVSHRSLQILTPTIRTDDSQIWISLNPDSPDAPVMQFVNGDRPDTAHVHVTYLDNPWFPKVLEEERAYLQSVDDDAYRHVWLGECRTVNDALILRGKFFAETFEVQSEWAGPFYGLDFGFSKDPTAGLRAFVDGETRTLYVTHEVWRIGADIDTLPALLDEIPGMRQGAVYADSARPETISYLQRHGYTNVRAVEKWKGSVEDGIAFLRQFQRIVIDPDCRHLLDECRSYSFRTDRLTNLPLPEPEDKNNHLIDALRYSLRDLIRADLGGIYSEKSFLAAAPTGSTATGLTAVDMPRGSDIIFPMAAAAVAESDSIGVVFFAVSRDTLTNPALIVVDWDIHQIEGDFIKAWLHGVIRRTRELETLCGAVYPRHDAVLVERTGLGEAIYQQAQVCGLLNVDLLAEEEISAKLPAERALSASGYPVKIARPAYEQTQNFKGVTKNHLLSQILGFSLSRDRTQPPGELLLAFANGVLRAFLDPRLQSRI
jgi:phage terminase large subunit